MLFWFPKRKEKKRKQTLEIPRWQGSPYRVTGNLEVVEVMTKGAEGAVFIKSELYVKKKKPHFCFESITLLGKCGQCGWILPWHLTSSFVILYEHGEIWTILTQDSQIRKYTSDCIQKEANEQ